MKRRPQIIFAMLFIATLPVGKVPAVRDSAQTDLSMYLATGQYAYISRGCEGNVLEKYDIPYQEVNVGIDHQTSSPFRFGLDASYVRGKKYISKEVFLGNEGYGDLKLLKSSAAFFVNPYFALDWRYFGIGLGIMGSSNGFFAQDSDYTAMGSLYYRIGNPQRIYLSGHFNQQSPLLAPGYFNIGVGSNRVKNFRWWLGMSVLPYDNAGFIGRASILLQRDLALNWVVRLGSSEGVMENAIGVGLTYSIKPQK